MAHVNTGYFSFLASGGVFARLRAPEIMRTRGAMTCTPFGVLFLALNTHLTLCSALPPRRASCLPNLC